MPSKPEQYVSEIAIVLVGNFNPVVFQPIWFANQKLLRTAEVESASVGVIHPDVVSFSTDWLSLQVTREKFVAITKTEPHASYLNDFIVGTFAKLEHTPMNQMGINCTFAIEFQDSGDWHNFGHYFSPKSPWSPFKDPGMLKVQIQSERTDGLSGQIVANVKYAGKNQATMMVNDHYDLPDNHSEKLGTADYFTSILSTGFQTSLDSAKDKIIRVLNNFTQTEKFDAS
jgi:hypothetical protein